MFSSRLPTLEPNALSRAVSRARASADRLIDLTNSNPTSVGLGCPPGLLAALAHPDAGRYAPEARGLLAAREAVADEYRRAGVAADASRVVLAAGTSDAYGLLFKLLADPGDDVLVPAPSYPLFELLTRFEGLTARTYRLDPDDDWRLDRSSIESALTASTRALLVVSPNNPTGSMLGADDRDWLVDLCGARRIAIIADEVFADYPVSPRATAVTLAGEARALTFTLGGLSKSVGLPQFKLAWMLAGGPSALVDEALERLELLCDTYLSVSTPVQLAAPALLAGGRPVREAIRARLARNLGALESSASRHPAVTVRRPEGGWSVVVRVPAVESEEALAVRLVRDHAVIVHPGFFFDFATEACLVLSLLPEPDVFDEGIARLFVALEGDR
jgi:hypothetical protein